MPPLSRTRAGGAFTRSPAHPTTASSRITLALCLLLISLLPQVARAQEGENRAGLVIVHGDGSIVQQCVSFAEESISGYELLQRGSEALSVEAGGFGATVCSIDGEGCSYPAESCFCQCQSSPCIYWSYWRQQADGGWRYQPLGAGNTQVRSGAVEGWRWAAGTRSSAPEPPAVRFEDICAPAAQAAGTATGAADSTPVQAAASGVLTTPAGTPSGTSSEMPSAAAEASAVYRPENEQVGMFGGALWLLLCAVVILPAAVLLIWAQMRRKR